MSTVGFFGFFTILASKYKPYYTAYNGKDVIFATMGKKDFIARLIDGIYNALIFTAENEKKNQLDLDQ